MVEGRYGEFTIVVEGEEIVSAGQLGFVGVLPSMRKVRELVKETATPTREGE
jgi:hypothetical protein